MVTCLTINLVLVSAILVQARLLRGIKTLAWFKARCFQQGYGVGSPVIRLRLRLLAISIIRLRLQLRLRADSEL